MDAGDPERSDMRIRPQVRDLTGPRGLPLFKPPYSQLTAFDMNAGEKLWSVPVGDGPRDHEALRDLELPRLGSFQKLGGPLLTKTLLFIGQGKETHRIGAYDKETGEELWSMDLGGQFHAAPTYTFELDGDEAGSEAAAASFDGRVVVVNDGGNSFHSLSMTNDQDGVLSVEVGVEDGEIYLIVASVPQHFSGNQTYSYRVRISRN
jgi:outer membrane protein assembly factor BamB